MTIQASAVGSFGTGTSESLTKIEHEYAIAAWALCVMPEVRKDVAARLTGTHRDAIEDVVRRLHLS